MKYTIYYLLIVVGITLSVSCNSCNKRDPHRDSIATVYVVQQTHTISSTDTMIAIGREEFALLAEYLSREGDIIVERNIPCDKQYILYDSMQNRHVLIALKRDEQGIPSMKVPVTQISVWVNGKDAKPGKEMFYYIIYPDYILMPKSGISHLSEIQKAYRQLLHLAANKQSY